MLQRDGKSVSKNKAAGYMVSLSGWPFRKISTTRTSI